MSSVYLLIDTEKNVVAVYDDENLAKKMKKPLEEKFKKELTVDKRSLNQDVSLVGVFK